MQAQRKFIAIIIIVSLTLVIWLYRSSNTEINKTILELKNNYYFLKDFVLQPHNATCKDKPYLLILVTSYVGHVELRSAHRRAMPVDLLDTMNISRVFLLARIPWKEKYITQESINDESNTFGDILQGSFLENYRNLTHKHLMGLQWASTTCANTSFILKVDDDTVFNLERTYKLLLGLKKVDRQNFLMGYMLNNTKAKRQRQNKWYVNWKEYSRSIYPPYLSGWYYVITPEVAARISNEAKYHSYFWIDDIFITGVLAEALNIELKQLPKDYWLEYYELLECCLRDMIKKSIWCDYVVAPNGGRNNLLVEFNDAIRNCGSWRNCTIRNVNEPLKKKCVGYRERDIFSAGQAEVHAIKLYH